MTSSVSRYIAPVAIALVLLLGGIDSVADADPNRTLHERVADHWGVPVSNVQIDWGPSLDERILQDAEGFHLLGNGRNGWMAVRVEQKKGFTEVYRIRAGVIDTVMVAARPLAAGRSLVAGDLNPELRTRWGDPRERGDALPRVGWEIRRAIAAGAVVEKPGVSPPSLIVAGDTVELAWSRGDLHIRAGGVALNTARLGELVRVRLEGRRKSLLGRVVGRGSAMLVGGSQR